ncbi:DUF262 domain-containing protein [Dictyobacter formicarum]|uniref:DUF262 domain-containing protein n=1 Tax=Dictyobacter formicarum TaxID=2778368 RepID=A0ABQ3V9A6_9CHLR|nr:DUF262 domain-containing protein [Dictyobacter formicarum]GHO82281.1 hypothetical protein KSZ_02870 [Dictyobacter formicarum]
MSYQTETIANILPRLNTNYFLPAIQREYVWHPDQIIQLFDSLMREYPIGSFLFWQIKPENLDKWDVYHFIQHYKQGGTHNELANTASIDPLTLILDGQQRLTSLYIGLKGSYTIKKQYLQWNNPKAWVKQSLYLDLLKDPQIGPEDTEEGIRFGFRFLENAPEPDGTSYWFKVGKILSGINFNQFHQLREQEMEKLPDTTTKNQIKLFQQNLDYLHYAIWTKHNIAYYTEQDQDYDRVLTIFVRANQGGTKLSKSDLLLSMVTAKWGNMNARDEIYAFVDRLNNQLSRKNDFEKDFVMKTCLVLSDLPVYYKVANFNNHNLARIHQNWNKICISIEAAVNLINSFGIDRETLTSANAIIPIIYYIYMHPNANFLGSSSFEVKNASIIRKWLLTVLLSNTFSGQSDRALTAARRVIIEQAQHSDDFPARALNGELRRAGRKVSLDEEGINDILNLSYGKPLTFLALSLLYDITNWSTISYQQDHIFPKSLFQPAKLNNTYLGKNQREEYLEKFNRIGNLQLLLSNENQEKANKPFEDWIKSRDESYKKCHLIPEDNQLLSFEYFGEFIAAREELIRKRLQQIIME